MAKTPRGFYERAERSLGDAPKRRREDTRRGDAPRARSAEERRIIPPVEDEPVKRGRGRPKEQHGTVVLTVRLPGDMVEQLDNFVAASGREYRDRSDFVRQAIAAALPGCRPGVTVYDGAGVLIGYLHHEPTADGTIEMPNLQGPSGKVGFIRRSPKAG